MESKYYRNKTSQVFLSATHFKIVKEFTLAKEPFMYHPLSRSKEQSNASADEHVRFRGCISRRSPL